MVGRSLIHGEVRSSQLWGKKEKLKVSGLSVCKKLGFRIALVEEVSGLSLCIQDHILRSSS